MNFHPRRSVANLANRPRTTRIRPRAELLESRALLSLTSIDFGATVTSPPVTVGSRMVFSATNSTSGDELWASDGTSSGTSMVMDINPGAATSYPRNFTVVGNLAFFTANDGTHGFEVWKTDGTAGGTSMVKDVSPGVFGSYPQDLVNVNGTLFFQAYSPGNGYELWKSDGSES